MKGGAARLRGIRMRSNSKTGVRARRRGALSGAAVAGLAGLAMGSQAWAEAAAADPGPTEVSGVDVTAQKDQLDSPKYTAKPLDTPQTVTVVPQGVIQAQNLLSLRDILSTVPGITFGAGEGGGGFGDSINLRGYAAGNDITVDGVRDSAQYSRSDPFNLEQLEVTNGANGVYSGSGSVGGTINMVSKRPVGRDGTTLSAGIGTDGYYRATIDSNKLLTDDIAVRLNAMVHRNDAPGRDVEKFERWGVAPAITFGLNGPTQFTVQYFHQEDKNTPQYGVPFFNGRPVPGVDPSDYFGYDNIDRQDQTVDMVTGIIEHRFGDNLSVRNLSRYSRVTQLIVVDPPQGVYCLADGTKPVGWSESYDRVSDTFTRNITGYAACAGADPAPGFYQPSGPRGLLRDTENTLLYNQTDLTWRFETGPVSHDLVIGAAFLAEDFHLTNGNLLRTPTGAAAVLPPMTIADPEHRWDGDLNFIQGGGGTASATATTSASGAQDGERRNQAVYLFDNVQFTPQWSLNFGLRYEHNEGANQATYFTYANRLPAGGSTLGPLSPGAPGGVYNGTGPRFENDETLFSYRVGLVYKPVPNASLYIAYGNSETPSQATVNGSGACNETTCSVDPEKAENIEIGGKWDVAGRLSLTAAIFRNDRTNYKVASGDPTVPEQVLDGSARVEGLSLGASGRITDKWSVFANYTYLQSEVLQGVSDYSQALGFDVTKGDDLLNVPDHAFSLFTTYDLPWNIQVGYGLTYQGEYYLTQHGLVTGTGVTIAGAPPVVIAPVRTSIPLVKAEDYVVQRLTVAWRATEALELRLNVNNLTDETYYSRVRNNGWATPGDARNATLTLNYRF